MATSNAMPSSRVVLLLLAATLAAVATVQGQATAPAPPPSADGQCSSQHLAALELCVDFRLGRVDLRGRDLATERERCCREVRGNPSATKCLCDAFSRANVTDPAVLAGDVNVVRSVCDLPEVSGLNCSASTSG